MSDFFVGSVKTARAHFLTADGAEAEVQGGITWMSSAPSGAVVFDLSGDPASKTIPVTLAAPVAGFTISAKADADLGDGVRELEIVSEPHNIIAAEAEGGVVTLE